MLYTPWNGPGTHIQNFVARRSSLGRHRGASRLGAPKVRTIGRPSCPRSGPLTEHQLRPAPALPAGSASAPPCRPRSAPRPSARESARSLPFGTPASVSLGAIWSPSSAICSRCPCPRWARRSPLPPRPCTTLVEIHRHVQRAARRSPSVRVDETNWQLRATALAVGLVRRAGHPLPPGPKSGGPEPVLSPRPRLSRHRP